jgi:MSHA biogenesis protein MshG
MPFFAYKGRNAQGALVEGLLESLDSRTLASQLLSQSITPVEIKPTQDPQASQDIEINLFKEKIDTLDVMLFSRQMYTLLKAGIPIMKALSGLEASTQKKPVKEVISDLRSGLDSGRELSSAMQTHPDVFSSFYINMVKVGETTGMLDSVFLRMFHHLEFERFMRDQVKSALRYPSFVLIAMIVAMIIVNIFVIPAFAKVFQTMGTDLPILTKFLLATSNFTQHYWFLLLVIVGGLFFGFRRYISTENGRLQWDNFKLQAPIAGKIIEKATLARFARSYALAGKSGVPIIQALTLVAQTVDNAFIAQKVMKMREGVERGESILRTANASGIFNPIVLQMIAVGEESGSIDELMEEIADMFQRDVEYDIKNLGAQIEPIMILFLGAMVLVLALGIFLPIWDLGNVALHKN